MWPSNFKAVLHFPGRGGGALGQTYRDQASKNTPSLCILKKYFEKSIANFKQIFKKAAYSLA